MSNFKIGEKIIFRNHGVCEIKDIIREDYGTGIKDYYVIVPIFHDTDSVIKLPKTQIDMFKKIFSKKKALELIGLLNKNNSIWIDNAKERKARFNDYIKEGNEEIIVSIIYSISKKNEELKSKNKQISMTDKLIYERCVKLIYEELAIALNIEYSEVEKFIEKRLK